MIVDGGEVRSRGQGSLGRKGEGAVFENNDHLFNNNILNDSNRQETTIDDTGDSQNLR